MDGEIFMIKDRSFFITYTGSEATLPKGVLGCAIVHTVSISVVKSTTRTLYVFFSGITDAVSTMDPSILRIVVL